MEIEGRVVLVTGASSGIGAAVARAAAAEGAKLVLLARRADRLEAVAADLPEALALPTDVTDRAQVEAAVSAALARFGRIDVLVNNAGQGLHLPLDQVKAEDFRSILELNVVAALGVIQAVLPAMRRQGEGAIVNVSSGSALMVRPGIGAYSASKTALDQLSAVARMELASDGIVVSNIHPFITSTEFHSTLRAGELSAGTERASRADSPERVAEAILGQVRSGAEDLSLVPPEFLA